MRVLRISHSAVVDAWRDRERALRRLGVDVALVAARSWDVGGCPVELDPAPGEPVTGVRTWGRHPALFVYDPRPLWRLLGQTWDVVDIHEEPFALATAEILLLRRLRRQRAPYTLYSAQNIDKRYPPPFRWLERAALLSAAGISVCNRAAAGIVQRKGLPGVASVIPLGVDLDRFRPGPARQVSGRVRVGYVGRLADHKGVAVLLEAVAGDERLDLRLAGSGPAEASLRALAADLGIEDRVRFQGQVGQGELPAFYASLDVLAVPSLTTASWVEQFGRVAVEAMACGVPVVASDSGALPDVVGGAGLLVPPGDAGALCKALLELGTDPDAHERSRAAGLARAEQCSWDPVGVQYLAMYHRAVHTPLDAASRELAVLVVAYGSPDLLRRALEPVCDLAVLVVDNSSSSAVRAVCEELGVRYLDPGRNGGFAAGVNTGLAALDTTACDVLLLNPDAVITPQAVAELHRALVSDPHLASVAPVQVDDRGVRARVHWPFPTPLGIWLESLGLRRLRRGPGFVIGSVLLLRAEALAQVGGFDERFFLYAEETDWALRATRLGWRHAVVPSATAIHAGAATSSDPTVREGHFHASQERYLRKHYGPAGWQVARTGHVLGAALRSIGRRGPRRDAARRRLPVYLRSPVRTGGQG